MKMKIVANKTASQKAEKIDKWIAKIKPEVEKIGYHLYEESQYKLSIEPQSSIAGEQIEAIIYLETNDDKIIPSCILETSHLNSEDYSSGKSIEKILNKWQTLGRVITMILNTHIDL